MTKIIKTQFIFLWIFLVFSMAMSPFIVLSFLLAGAILFQLWQIPNELSKVNKILFILALLALVVSLFMAFSVGGGSTYPLLIGFILLIIIYFTLPKQIIKYPTKQKLLFVLAGFVILIVGATITNEASPATATNPPLQTVNATSSSPSAQLVNPVQAKTTNQNQQQQAQKVVQEKQQQVQAQKLAQEKQQEQQAQAQKLTQQKQQAQQVQAQKLAQEKQQQAQSPQQNNTPAPSPQQPSYVIKSDGYGVADLHASPSSHSKKIAELYNGTSVTVLSNNGSYDYVSANGQQGYVYRDFIHKNN